MMFQVFKTRSDGRRKARELYGAVVAQARHVEFYRDMGVPDTPEGRYEMIALHLVLVLDRLGGADTACEALRQETLETFITDMDDAMREMGVGDQVVPRRVKKAAAGVYARGVAYREAVRSDDPALLDTALVTYVYATAGGADAPTAALGSYVRRYVAHLAAQSRDEIMVAKGLDMTVESRSS
jgi:cytochrome b pre-mRNA-processing protein 3